MPIEIRCVILGFILCFLCVALVNIVNERRDREEEKERQMRNWKKSVENELEWNMYKTPMWKRLKELEDRVNVLTNKEEPPKG